MQKPITSESLLTLLDACRLLASGGSGPQSRDADRLARHALHKWFSVWGLAFAEQEEATQEFLMSLCTYPASVAAAESTAYLKSMARNAARKVTRARRLLPNESGPIPQGEMFVGQVPVVVELLCLAGYFEFIGAGNRGNPLGAALTVFFELSPFRKLIVLLRASGRSGEDVALLVRLKRRAVEKIVGRIRKEATDTMDASVRIAAERIEVSLALKVLGARNRFLRLSPLTQVLLLLNVFRVSPTEIAQQLCMTGTDCVAHIEDGWRQLAELD